MSYVIVIRPEYYGEMSNVLSRLLLLLLVLLLALLLLSIVSCPDTECWE